MSGGRSSRQKGAEEWRPMVRFPHHAVSETGRVRRVTVSPTRKAGYTPAGRITADGYRSYKLATPSGKREIKAHRAVLEAFVGPPPSPCHMGAHNDGNRLHNHVSNLRWATVAENNADTARHGSLKGERNGRARLNAEQVADARRRYTGKHGQQSQLAREYGISPSAMRALLLGERWNG